MLELILGISLLELVVSIIILIDFGPETARKVQRWGIRVWDAICGWWWR